MKTFFLKSELIKELNLLSKDQKTVGLVPTMGALHQGHVSLVKQCAFENDVVIVSIFVNPTQFNNSGDLEKYPRDLERDQNFLKNRVDKPLLIFAPEVNEMYSEELESVNYDFQGLENEMEGEFRPGHFDGVATIVSKLFEVVGPDKAYFGEKDYQQLLIIKRMVEILKIPVTIVPCRIFRENDGLAMSSRNERLTDRQRAVAPLIYQVLKSAKSRFGTENATVINDWVQRQFMEEPLLELEYFTIADSETLQSIKEKEDNNKYRAFIAVFAGDVRLIDNIALN
ncbi:pantoate--beta-alanine ligase [Winogradskyella aurantiaca]|uniref:pantoate--beta-alanine ligase n=1 Tax=Winogradskyella aurantiaca TaxID=2219558 RepID=UPI000E1DFE22|nr:pantoate--beta-alanine ligase [Winogradskyella aurantiaca]